MRDYQTSLFRPRKKKNRAKTLVKWLLVLGLVAAGVLWFQGVPRVSQIVLEHLPVPHRLVGLQVQINGKPQRLPAGAQRIVHPEDRLEIVAVETDGWIPWGVKLFAGPVPWPPSPEGPLSFKELFPQEDFETPLKVPLRARWFGRELGAVSFVAKLGAKDWLHKADSAQSPEEKVRFLERALAEDPGNTLAKTRLAALYADQGRLAEAEKLYQEILRLGRSRPVLERLVHIYQRQKKHEAVLTTYLELLRLTDDPSVFEAFLAYLNKHLSVKRALAFLSRHLKEVPTRYRGPWFLVQAELASRSRRWGEAARAYEAALKAGVRDPNIHYNLSVVRAKTGDLKRAVADLEKYLEANPKDEANQLKLAALYEKLGRDDQAKRVYQRVLKRNPTKKAALVRLLALLEKTGDKKGQLKAYEMLSTLEPDNAVVHFNRAMLYYELQQWDKAEKAFAKVARLEPDNPEPLHYLLALRQKRKDAKGQVPILRRLVELEKDNLSYYDTLFVLYDQAKDYDQILKLFEKAVQDHPQVVAFHQYILYAALKKGDKKKALHCLEQLSRLMPKEVKYLRQAARIHESLGQYRQALEKTKRILDVSPGDEQAKEDYLRLKLLLLGNKKASFFYCIERNLVV
ncbi:tetratricopeptide repeat protein [Desulfacinum hydrothermale]|uniref:tetratricopeptide repeat protein n=1 Tax=Desulfacinum hydrothermale TaxID=109258 RepID=UPI00148247DB|nr:tetratricopeptide repeat protein [Desulfacinum hydrothermale]